MVSLWALLVWTTSLGAAQLGPAAVLDLAQAVRCAQMQHPDVVRAAAEAEIVLSRKVGAALILPANPQVDVSVGHRHDDSGSVPAATGTEWTVMLQQMVDVAGQRGLRLREVDWAVRAAQHELELARLQAGVLGGEAFVAAQMAHTQADVAHERAALAERVLTMVQDKEALGASGGLERTLAQVEVGEAQAGEARAHLQAHLAEDALRYALGLGADVDLTLAPLSVPDKAPGALHDGDLDELAGLVTQVAANRPHLRALEAQAQGLGAGIKRLYRDAVPSPVLGIEAQHQQPGQLYVGGALSVQLPVVQRNQGPLAELQAAQARNAQEQALAWRTLRRDVAQGRARQVRTWAILNTVAQTQLPAAQDHAEMTVEAWRAGKLDILRVVQSVRFIYEARQSHAEALAAVWLSRLNWQHMLGLPP